MFKKSIFIAALLLVSSAAFFSVDAKPLRTVIGCDPSNAPGGTCVVDPSNIRDHRTPTVIRDHRLPTNIRDHRCPASQGGNCVGPERVVVVPPPSQQPPGCGFAGCAPPPPQSTDCDPRVCDDFGQGRPHRPRPVVIIDPIDIGGSHWGISCGQGRNIVRNSGYRRVRVIDCSGRKFTYSGTRHGEVFGVVVNRRGRIVDVFEAP